MTPAAVALLASLAQASAVDLHVHLLMNEAVPMFRGEPSDEPANVTDRTARFRNQVSLKDLQAADVRLVVAALYSPTTSGALRQIAKLEKWAAEHPKVALVKTPDEAQAILDAKEWRLGVLVGLEGGKAVGSLEKLDRLYDRGLRLLTIAHFYDSPWAGAAKVNYWPRPSCHPGGPPDERRNAKGLTPLGETLVDRAVEKGLLLDLTHSSDKAAFDLAKRHPELPLLYTHQAARERTPCERTLSKELLDEVRRSGGMVGVTFASSYVGDRLQDLAAHAKLLAQGAGAGALALGSDYNGMIPRVEGLADSTGYPKALRALAAENIPADESAQAFVKLWRRSLSAAGRRTPRPADRRG